MVSTEANIEDKDSKYEKVNNYSKILEKHLTEGQMNIPEVVSRETNERSEHGLQGNHNGMFSTRSRSKKSANQSFQSSFHMKAFDTKKSNNSKNETSLGGFISPIITQPVVINPGRKADFQKQKIKRDIENKAADKARQTQLLGEIQDTNGDLFKMIENFEKQASDTPQTPLLPSNEHSIIVDTQMKPSGLENDCASPNTLTGNTPYLRKAIKNVKTTKDSFENISENENEANRAAINQSSIEDIGSPRS